MKSLYAVMSSVLLATGCLDADEPSLAVREQAASPDCGPGQLLVCEDDANGEVTCWCEDTGSSGGGSNPKELNWIEILAGTAGGDIIYYDCEPPTRAGALCTDGAVVFDMFDVRFSSCVENPRLPSLTCELSPSSSPSLPSQLTDGLSQSVLDCPDGTILACEFDANDEVVCWCQATGSGDGDGVDPGPPSENVSFN